MDPITQGALGAFAAKTLKKEIKYRKEKFLISALSAMAPDLDIFFTFDEPFSLWKWHRGFTHSLLFIPIGSLICAIVLSTFFKKKLQFKEVLLFSLIGYATHGLLDLFTTYGTEIFWPFTNSRIGLDLFPIIDPLFTIALILFLYFKSGSIKIKITTIVIVLYPIMAFIQHKRAQDLGKEIFPNATIMRSLPTPGQLYVWRIIAKQENQLCSQIAKIGFTTRGIYQECKIKINLNQFKKDKTVELFKNFSNGWIFSHSKKPNAWIWGDFRYTIGLENIPMWGLKFKNGTYSKFENKNSMNIKSLFNIIKKID